MKWPASERCLGDTLTVLPPGWRGGATAGPRSLVDRPWPLVSLRMRASSSSVQRIQNKTLSEAASAMDLQSSFATRYRGGVSPSLDHTSLVTRVSGAPATPLSHPGRFVLTSTFGQTILERLGQSWRMRTVSEMVL